MGHYRWDSNVGSDFPAALYPGGANEYPTLAALRAQFEDAARGDLRLRANSVYRAGGGSPPSDGAMRGADVALVDCLTRAVDGN